MKLYEETFGAVFNDWSQTVEYDWVIKALNYIYDTSLEIKKILPKIEKKYNCSMSPPLQINFFFFAPSQIIKIESSYVPYYNDKPGSVLIGFRKFNGKDEEIYANLIIYLIGSREEKYGIKLRKDAVQCRTKNPFYALISDFLSKERNVKQVPSGSFTHLFD